MNGNIFNIQKFSINDGPGIRTTVFFKGCNLRCIWCHNPESWSPKKQILFAPNKCISCGKCFEVCPVNAHQMINGERVFLRDLCQGCGKCAETCYAEALTLSGKSMSVEEVMEEVIKDKPFYDNSGGGVTFSGGECMLQIEFLKKLLIECKKLGLNTAIDTSGDVPWEYLKAIIEYVDIFLYDIKVFDEEKHKEVVGISNKRIIENLKKLGKENTHIFIRTPIIPGVNNTKEEMENIALLLKNINNIDLIELLPFHHLGKNKYENMGLEYKVKDIVPPTDEEINRLSEPFKKHGLNIKER